VHMKSNPLVRDIFESSVSGATSASRSREDRDGGIYERLETKDRKKNRDAKMSLNMKVAVEDY
jgi:hypothetical protein